MNDTQSQVKEAIILGKLLEIRLKIRISKRVDGSPPTMATLDKLGISSDHDRYLYPLVLASLYQSMILLGYPLLINKSRNGANSLDNKD